jgi:hypothetical protein
MTKQITLSLPSLKALDTLKQPRFIATVIAAALGVINGHLGLKLSSGELLDVSGTAVAFILGDSYVHGKFVSSTNVPKTSTPAADATR